MREATYDSTSSYENYFMYSSRRMSWMGMTLSARWAQNMKHSHADLQGFFSSLERHLYSLKQTFTKRDSIPCLYMGYAGAISKPTATTFNRLTLEVHRHSVMGIGDGRTTTHIVIQGHLKRARCDTKCFDVDSWCQTAWPYSLRLD